MKRTMFLLALLASACSVDKNGSQANGVPVSDVFGPRLNLSCAEKQTMVDAPGYEHSLSIRLNSLPTASASRRSIAMTGMGEWEDNGFYDVVDSTSDDGVRTLSLTEAVDMEVDWATHGACFKFIAQKYYALTQQADGRWEGQTSLHPIMKLDPDVKGCSYPHMALPPAYEIACSAAQPL